MVDAVEPAAPEPVEVDAAGVLHRAEEVGRGGALEHPAAGVGLEGVVEGFPAEDVLAEDGEGGGRLAVGVGSEVDDGLRVRHRGDAVLAAHVVDQAAAVAPRLPLVLPLGFGERFEEGVQALVHPGPLTFVAIDDHREVIVSDLMDDHADERVLGAFRVGAVRFRPRTVEADHRILHAADGAVDGPGHRVGVVEGVPGVDLDRVGDGVGGILIPERHAFLGVEGHRHHRLAVHLGAGDGHGVPDELAGRGEGEVADVAGLEAPGLLAFRAALFGGFRFFGRDHEDGAFGLLAGLGETLALDGREYFLGILEQACGGDDVVIGHGEGDLVVAELEGELAGAEELLVDPTGVVGVSRHAGEPLGDGVDMVPVFLEELEARAGHDALRVIDRIGPGDLEHEVVAGLQRFGQIESQHGLHDRMREAAPLGVGESGDLQFAVVFLIGEQPVEGGVAELLEVDAAFLIGSRAGVGALGEVVLVQLDPEVLQGVGGRIVVSHRRLGRERFLFIVEFGPDVVIRPVLPIARARRSGRQPLGGGGG